MDAHRLARMERRAYLQDGKNEFYSTAQKGTRSLAFSGGPGPFGRLLDHEVRVSQPRIPASVCFPEGV